MLAFLARHSAICLFIAALIGFAFPAVSLGLFPFLPYVLFALMLFTLLGIHQGLLVKALGQWQVWIYAFIHAVVLTLITCSIAWLLGASTALLLAISGICATGSLFATPAIIRSLGMDALIAMAYTIASTLMMPVVLFVNLTIFSGDAFSLDLQSYVIRLVVFIVGPMAFAAVFHALVKPEKLKRIHGKLAQFTIVLVFSFPLGLVGPFGEIWQNNQAYALELLAISVAICILFFCNCLRFISATRTSSQYDRGRDRCESQCITDLYRCRRRAWSGIFTLNRCHSVTHLLTAAF